VICGRCQESIKANEEYETHDNPGASAAGCVIHIHKRPCKKAPQQTSPTQSYWERRGWRY
jgi:hypothetical protein